jgi:hypothetical protein
MNKYLYIIAGNRNEFAEYVHRKVSEMDIAASTYRYVVDINSIRGLINPVGAFIGTWKERKDIVEIVAYLRSATNNGNPSLDRIYQMIRPKVQPLTHRSTTVPYNAQVQQAADDFAKAIDEEVLRTLLQQSPAMVNPYLTPDVLNSLFTKEMIK